MTVVPPKPVLEHTLHKVNPSQRSGGKTDSRTKEPMDPCAFLVHVARCLQDLFANSFLIFQFSGSWVAFEHQASPRRAEPSCPPWLQFLEDAFGL